MLVSLDLYDSIYEVIDAIKKSREYLDVKDALDKLEKDEYTSKLIDEFIKSRDLYNKYPTKENTINLSKIKKELYSNNLYKDYINKLKVYNTEIERIEKEIDNALYSKELKNLLKSRCIHD